MKVLVSADIHYALRHYDWLVSVAADFDLVVLAGDLLELSSSVDRRAQIVVVRAYLEQLAQKTCLAVCSGNHDLDLIDATGEQVADWMRDLRDLGVNTDGTTLRIDRTLITICPWWDGPVTRDSIGAQLAQASGEPRDRWIWVTHAPPDDSPVSWGGKRSFGDAELTRWIAAYGPDNLYRAERLRVEAALARARGAQADAERRYLAAEAMLLRMGGADSWRMARLRAARSAGTGTGRN